MISSNANRKINFLLALTIGVIASTSTVNQASAHPLPVNPKARLVAIMLAIGIPSFVRLYTKGTPKELKGKTKLDDTWTDCWCDWVEMLKIWNIYLQPGEYKKLIEKRWIGTKFSLLDIEIKKISKDGLQEETVYKKKIECLPTGVCGKIDAYVFKQFEKLFKTIGGIEKALVFYCVLHGIDIEKIKESWLLKPSEPTKA